MANKIIWNLNFSGSKICWSDPFDDPDSPDDYLGHLGGCLYNPDDYLYFTSDYPDHLGTILTILVSVLTILGQFELIERHGKVN